MVEKSCLVTDMLPNNDISNRFGETWSEIKKIYFQVQITVNVKTLLFAFLEKEKNYHLFFS